MKVKITPSKVSGTIAIPASKSISHRAIICASLAQGKSTITNLTFSKDIEATISCMRSFGAKIEVQKNSCIIEGCNLFDLQDGICCDCNESGSTLRFLIPAGALSNKKVTYLGKGRLLERPMGIYQKIFDEQKHQACTNVSSQLIKENIRYVLQSEYKDKVIIRTPLIPTMSATDENIHQIVKFLIQINPEVKYEMLNYNPLASAKYELVNLKYGLESYQMFTKQQMQHFYDVALQAGIKNLIKE